MASKRTYQSNEASMADPGLALVESLLPPHSVESEQAVLGGILFSPDAFNKIIELIRPDDFYRGPHKHIFEAMTDLYNKGEPIDIITVSEMLNDKEALEAAGGRPYVMDLAMSVATAENIVYYARIIRNKALLRQLITAGNEIASSCYEINDAEQAIDQAQQAIFQIAQHGTPNDLTHIKDILPESWDQIEERCANKGSLMGVSTGFYDLDSYTSGLQKSDLIILAARPSMGKTAFCLNIVTHVAMREQKPTLVFSLEMGKEQLVLRMLCAEAELDAHKIKTGEIGDHEFHRLNQAMGKLSDAPIYIDDTPGLSVMEMRAKARKIQMEAGGDLGLIVIDYLQLMQGPGGGSSTDANRTQEISAISRGLKGLARELKVPVIALSQLSRAVEQRQDKKPMLSDLRESGAIEQDADLVMFIYRDEYYNKDSERPGTADIIIAKHRNGAVGEIELLFRNSITRFLNPADRKVQIF
ncbi:MAG: replicative helicase [Vampirovibrio sp.]|jgi:replicative DNA helicase|nr:replicative helicase [Vampirovibrio sp.]